MEHTIRSSVRNDIDAYARIAEAKGQVPDECEDPEAWVAHIIASEANKHR